MPVDSPDNLKCILEAALLASHQPLSLAKLSALFDGEAIPDNAQLISTLNELREDCEGRGVELVEVASGYRYQVRSEYNTWVTRLWAERQSRYSRALMETLALIAYRQPVTRGEIEQVRGVAVSTKIVRTLEEREWIRVVGHRDAPGKPALFGTTRAFLDYFQLKSLDELPTLAEVRDLENFDPELQFEQTDGAIPAAVPDDQAGLTAEDAADAPDHDVEDNATDPPQDDEPGTQEEPAETEDQHPDADHGTDEEERA